MRLLLPEAVRLGVRVITNMGAGEWLPQNLNGFDVGFISTIMEGYMGAEHGMGCVASVQWILWVLRKKLWSWLLNWAFRSPWLSHMSFSTLAQVFCNHVCRFIQGYMLEEILGYSA